MVRPFVISEESRKLVGCYPPADLLRAVARAIPNKETRGLVRLWLSEGIPFAFREVPMIYEAIRGWLANLLGVDPKAITVIGSARIGYSLAPPPIYGRPFSSVSDLDVSVVSEIIFRDLSASFVRWEADMAHGYVRARNPREERYWPENLRRLPANIAAGFVDAYKIPTLDRYPTVQKVEQTKYLLERKMATTPGVPQVSRVSIRVYRDWGAFVAQMSLNISLMLRDAPGE